MCNAKTRLLWSYRRKWRTNFQGMAPCAKISGISILITRSFQIITKGLITSHAYGNWHLKKKKELICHVNLVKNIMKWSRPCKGKRLWVHLYTPRMSMLKETNYSNHQHKKYMMKMKRCNHRRCRIKFKMHTQILKVGFQCSWIYLEIWCRSQITITPLMSSILLINLDQYTCIWQHWN